MLRVTKKCAVWMMTFMVTLGLSQSNEANAGKRKKWQKQAKERMKKAGPKIRVMTLNVPFFPLGIKMGKHSKRVKALVKTIQNLKPRPHIIALQEVWRDAIKKEIGSKLRKDYPFQYKDKSMGKRLVGLNSGLMLLSQFPILKKRLLHYKRSHGVEKWAKKGVLGVKIQLPKGKAFYLFSTHLQASSKKKDNNVKISQLKEVRALVKRFVGKDKCPILLVGDFNLSKKKNLPTLKKAKAIFPGMKDMYNPPKGKALPSSTWKGMTLLKKAQRVDHMWRLRGKVKGYAYLLKDFHNKISDHLALFGIFQLSSF